MVVQRNREEEPVSTFCLFTPRISRMSQKKDHYTPTLHWVEVPQKLPYKRQGDMIEVDDVFLAMTRK